MISTVSSRKFDYHGCRRTFVAELSDFLRADLGGGFYIQSEKTGVKKLFLYEKMDTDGEDVAGWWYYCPGENLKALIIND